MGYAYAAPHQRACGVSVDVNTAIYISGTHQRRGAGRALYTTLFDLLRHLGYYRAVAGITLPNPASVGLHEALGFELVGVYRDIGYKLGAWRDVGWYEARDTASARSPLRAPCDRHVARIGRLARRRRETDALRSRRIGALPVRYYEKHFFAFRSSLPLSCFFSASYLQRRRSNHHSPSWKQRLPTCRPRWGRGASLHAVSSSSISIALRSTKIGSTRSSRSTRERSTKPTRAIASARRETSAGRFTASRSRSKTTSTPPTCRRPAARSRSKDLFRRTRRR